MLRIQFTDTHVKEIGRFAGVEAEIGLKKIKWIKLWGKGKIPTQLQYLNQDSRLIVTLVGVS